MTKLTWGAPGERFYESGVDRGVLYVNGQAGVAWSGLVSFTESSTGGESKPVYMDGIRFRNGTSPEEFGATIEAYTYPPQFDRCTGTLALATGLSARLQRRRPFGLCYRTKIGTDLDSEKGYKLHLVYDVTAAPSERAYKSQGVDPDPMLFSWSLTALPQIVSGVRPTPLFTVDSTVTDPSVLSTLEDILYGSPVADPRLPYLDELIDLFETLAPPTFWTVVNLPNGLVRISGSDEEVEDNGDGSFDLNHDNVVSAGSGSYTVTS